MLSKKWHYLLLIIAFILLFALWQSQRPYPTPPKLTAAQETKMNNLLAEMKTHCIGRYLIDLPSSFDIYKSNEHLDKDSWIADISKPDDSYKTYITTKRMYHPAFVQLIKHREEQLMKSKSFRIENMPFLKKIWPLSNNMDGVIFERNENESVGDALRILEGYLYSNNVVIKLQKQTVNDSDPRYEKQRDGDPIRNDVSKDISQMQSLMARISGRNNDDIPTVPGSCITNAFIATDPQETDKEDISAAFINGKLDNVRLVAANDNYTREQYSVLERAGEIESNISQARGHLIRKGPLIINNLHAEEFLISGLQESKDEARYGFSFFINEKNAGYKTPGFRLSLDNQRLPPTSYSREEIITFWDTITHTIRLRPGAF